MRPLGVATNVGDMGQPALAQDDAGLYVLLKVDAGGNLLITLPSDLVRSEDEASAGGQKGLPILAVRQDAPANSSGADGDYEPLRIAGGKLWVRAPELETLLTTLAGYVDGLEGFTDGLEALAALLNGYVDGLEALNGLIRDGQDADKVVYQGVAYTIQHALIEVAGAGNNEIVALAGASQYIILGYDLHSNGNVTARFKSNDVAKSGPVYLTQYSGKCKEVGKALVKCTASQNMQLNLSAAIAVGGDVWYIVVG